MRNSERVLYLFIAGFLSERGGEKGAVVGLVSQLALSNSRAGGSEFGAFQECSLLRSLMKAYL